MWYKLSLCQPYFCGMDPECPTHNSRWALNRAIENVEKHFPVVGVLEDLDLTLKLMQKALPMFFKGIWDMFGQNTREYSVHRGLQQYLREASLYRVFRPSVE